jgi:hypothetical protein
MTGEMRCRICGLLQEAPIWGEDGGSPSWDICACCGSTFGYEDCLPEAIRANRERWLARGATWFRPDRVPEGWRAEEQLARVPAFFFRILPGLPASGAAPLSFTATGTGSHAEGVVIEFTLEDGVRWVGNFQPGMDGTSAVLAIPGRRDQAIVVAKGQGYVVEPATRNLVCVLDCTITDMFVLEARGVVIFGNGLWFECIGPAGPRWRTRRISWDGIADARVDGDQLRGQAYDPMTEGWTAFGVDIDTGEVTGGSYPTDLP